MKHLIPVVLTLATCLSAAALYAQPKRPAPTTPTTVKPVVLPKPKPKQEPEKIIPPAKPFEPKEER